MPDAIQNHLNTLVRQAHTAEGSADAQALLALFDPDQDLDTFRAACLSVPLVQHHGRWCIPNHLNDEMWRDVAAAEHQWGHPNASNEACRKHLDTMVEGAQNVLPEQPLLPVLMASTQQWLLFYAADLFDAFRDTGHVAGLRLRTTDLGHLHELQLSQGDPVAWFFDRLVTIQHRQRAQREQDFQDGCVPQAGSDRAH